MPPRLLGKLKLCLCGLHASGICNHLISAFGARHLSLLRLAQTLRHRIQALWTIQVDSAASAEAAIVRNPQARRLGPILDYNGHFN